MTDDTDRATALDRLRAARDAGWPDPLAVLDDCERALGGRPSRIAMPASRTRALWYTTDRDTGFPFEDVKLVEEALQAIDRPLVGSNPQGLDADFDPTESPEFREMLQRQSNARRDADGHPRIDLFPEDGRPLYGALQGDRRTRQGLIAEALRLLDLAHALPYEAPPAAERDHTDNPVHAATVQAYADAAAIRSHVHRMSDAPRYPVEDGPGSGRFVELTVRVMVGTARSTVIVSERDRGAALHEIRQHGRETDGLGATVEAAVQDGIERLKG
ncbi:hypothetical protein HCU64_00120 [Methylobacterium sp. C25]|uniref:hypothetical protein n=1 Tax=Methylobacterium sp. C25 TaxID=2721622 RepID=UPI001F34D478|nr:hypothetical protein [Methylobacterium sp. C25]MCE4222144.1 hypothetical protein [Methylobacterium sp. C25]